MTTTWAAGGLTATLMGVERGIVRRKTRWVVRFETTSHVVEMRRDELVKFFAGRLTIAESMKNPLRAFLFRPSPSTLDPTAAAVLGDVSPDSLVLARTEPEFSALIVLSAKQGESLAQWIDAPPA